MKNIFLAGAGRSSTALIRFLLKEIDTYDWTLVVGDARIEVATKKIHGHDRAKAVRIDVRDRDQMQTYIEDADIVISLMPPRLHIEVARLCLELRTHLVTASYLSDELEALRDEIEEEDLIFMTELGLDPGIDHMSSVQNIDTLRREAGNITAFKSYTGGLIAPDCDDNPWHYKFTWNPKNVVLAGQGTAQYYEHDRRKYIPYHRLFSNYQCVDIQGMGTYEMYPNRDALRYRSIYNLQDIPTILRGTLRNSGFCDAWHALVFIGLTDDSFKIRETKHTTYREWLNAFVPEKRGQSLEKRTADLLEISLDSRIMEQLKWAGVFSEQYIELEEGTPAEILQKLLMSKWELNPDDRDMIIMQHEFEYENGEGAFRKTSTLVQEGSSAEHTAMSKLVGYPLGIFTSLVLRNKIHPSGLRVPVDPEVYNPVLEELKQRGVVFEEKVEKIMD